MQFGLRTACDEFASPGAFPDKRAVVARMRMLKEWGAAFVEIGFSESSDLDKVSALAAICREELPLVTFHPHVLKDMAPDRFSAQKDVTVWYEKMLAIADKHAGSAMKSRVVLHGGRAEKEPNNTPRRTAAANAKKFFRWIDRLVRKRFPGVLICAETQLPVSASSTGPARIGDTYSSCMDLIKGTRCGICWDMGHTYQGAVMGKHPLMPSASFEKMVRHVHVHDAVRSGKSLSDRAFTDHLPLDTGLVSWRAYINSLARNGFNETVLLEIRGSSAEQQTSLKLAAREFPCVM